MSIIKQGETHFPLRTATGIIIVYETTHRLILCASCAREHADIVRYSFDAALFDAPKCAFCGAHIQ